MTTAPAARTATFLMTDIEGSTRLWEEGRAAMAIALEAHDALLRPAVERAGGTVVMTTGDAQGHAARAARLLGAAEAMREVAEAPMTAFERDEYDAAVARSRSELDADDLRQAWADGRLMTADAAVAFALSLVGDR